MLESQRNSHLNYMNLYDHPGPSGVPLGSIGTGYFSIAPNGTINRAALHDTFTQHIIRNIKGSFFAVYEHNLASNAKTAYRMVRDNAQYGSMRGYEHTFYRGMYPFVGMSFGKSELLPETRVALEAFSPIIPHNIKDSSLPVAFFEVHLQNPSGGRKSVSIAFSWEDLLGRHVFDIKDEKLFEQVKEIHTGHSALNSSIIARGYKLLQSPGRTNTSKVLKYPLKTTSSPEKTRSRTTSIACWCLLNNSLVLRYPC